MESMRFPYRGGKKKKKRTGSVNEFGCYIITRGVRNTHKDLVLSHGDVADGDTHAENLLKLELDYEIKAKK